MCLLLLFVRCSWQTGLIEAVGVAVEVAGIGVSVLVCGCLQRTHSEERFALSDRKKCGIYIH